MTTEQLSELATTLMIQAASGDEYPDAVIIAVASGDDVFVSRGGDPQKIKRIERAIPHVK